MPQIDGVRPAIFMWANARVESSASPIFSGRMALIIPEAAVPMDPTDPPGDEVTIPEAVRRPPADELSWDDSLKMCAVSESLVQHR